MDLLIMFNFIDTSTFVEGHPGVTLRASASGPRVFQMGLGDDSPQWNVDDVQLKVFRGPPLVDRIRSFATVESASDDPAPFAPVELDENGFNTWVTKQNFARQSAFFIMRVERFWQWNLVYGVLPVLLCAILGLLVFFQDPGDLGGRISVIVTVFLAMTAIQFVLNDSTPQSTYIQPLQQCILIIYICFSVSAIESIIVYNFVHWKAFSAEKQARRASWEKYKQRMQEWKHYKTHRDRKIGLVTDNDSGGSNGLARDHFVDAAETSDETQASPSWGQDKKQKVSSHRTRNIGFGPSGLMRRLGMGNPTKPEQSDVQRDNRQLHREETLKPTIGGILREDSDYGKALAYYIDKWTFAMETLCYLVAIPVIFATQSGYVKLFSNEILLDQGMG